MRIYVFEGLEDLKCELESKGYTILSDYTTPCDAIICDLKNCDINKINIGNKTEGTLIVDCGSKSAEELDYILNNRCYSSII